MSRFQHIDPEAVMYALEEDENVGFCLSCGAENYGCEPDMRAGTCEDCGRDDVCGAEELLIMGACG